MCKKLTQEVFQRDDCPKWAKYAAVDDDGTAHFFDTEPDCAFGYGKWVVDTGCRVESIADEFDGSEWENGLVKRPETNDEWLCNNLDVLAKKLIHFDDRFDQRFEPDGMVFDSYDAETDTYSPDRAEERCVEYTMKWLKQEHEERENDKRR